MPHVVLAQPDPNDLQETPAMHVSSNPMPLRRWCGICRNSPAT